MEHDDSHPFRRSIDPTYPIREPSDAHPFPLADRVPSVTYVVRHWKNPENGEETILHPECRVSWRGGMGREMRCV